MSIFQSILCIPMLLSDPTARENAKAFPSSPEMIELLPNIHVGKDSIEIPATVCIDAHSDETPDIYLEMLVTGKNSREHESLFVTDIPAADLHAALLIIGAEAGTPARWSYDDNGQSQTHRATGSRVEVSYRVIDSAASKHLIFQPIEQLVVDSKDQKELTTSPSWNGLVFAGSKFDENGYLANRTGTLISLFPFGDDVVSPVWTMSHVESINAPLWIANRELIPPQDTEVTIRIRLVVEVNEKAKSNELPNS